MTQITDDTADQDDALYVAVVNGSATILCHRHTKAYAEIMGSLDMPMTIVEMSAEDASQHFCLACDMQDELDKPQIILPH
jgi:hypothetical protein